MTESDHSHRAIMPSIDALMPVVVVPSPHPAVESIEAILSQTQNRFQRRSGPGGQHRNKTSSGVFLLHEPTGVSVEATERRSQADNRIVAATRLRYRLAIQVRTQSTMTSATATDPVEQKFRDSYQGTRLKLNDANADKPAVLALLLNDLHATGGQPSLVAKHWSVSTSSILHLVKSQQDAFGWINSVRLHHGRKLLK
ncbi:Peptide chain release factor 1 [Rubripirellula obstinata]|uniref:Peptide chain release factor 1 n=1 Tax=Rubripirellula obstinata TaxID=406547 RepID=A0A5B1CE62_9BACT|nr:peptide chain release factor-like protein [Rubripirellula obstinata]KAA1259438.1 Peptide chain release factor 1 [Rubripirellula obstinata]